MTIPPVYGAGTASINAGETAVAGQGTTWLTSGIREGDLFWAAGLSVRIASVNSNTSLTLAYAWPGTNRTAAAYEIRYTPDSERVLATSRQMLTTLGSNAVAPLASLTPAANKLAYYTGVGAAALADLTNFARGLLGAASADAMRALLGWREVLTASRTYYVRTDGNDSNNGLANSAGGAFKTLQKAINVVATLDLAIFDVTISVADGTYSSGPISLMSPIGAGKVAIVGNRTTPANVTLSFSGNGILAQNHTVSFEISGFRLITSGANAYAMDVLNDGKVVYGRLVFATGAVNWRAHIRVNHGGSVTLLGGGLSNYEIADSPAWYHIYVAGGFYSNAWPTEVTLTGSIAWGFAGFIASGGFCLVASAVTFVGSATGTRYVARENGVLSVQGAGANFLPGSIAGYVQSGGQYL